MIQHRQQSSLAIHPYNAAEALSFLMQFEGFVYVLEAQLMRCELVQTKLLQNKQTSLVAHSIFKIMSNTMSSDCLRGNSHVRFLVGES